MFQQFLQAEALRGDRTNPRELFETGGRTEDCGRGVSSFGNKVFP